MTARRYLIVDLSTGMVLTDEPTLDEALDELGERKLDYFGEGWDGCSSPDYGVIDLVGPTMFHADRGQLVRHWYDGFSATWRPILEVVA